jgi:hypothetical protein
LCFICDNCRWVWLTCNPEMLCLHETTVADIDIIEKQINFLFFMYM